MRRIGITGIVGWIVFLGIAMTVIQSPYQAANVVNNFTHELAAGGTNVANFLSGLHPFS
jgi:hypothetical protein